MSRPRSRGSRPRPAADRSPSQRRLNQLTSEEQRSLTHGDFWIPEDEREMYKAALAALNAAGVPYVVAGAFAIHEHTGICRQTKDLDILIEPEQVGAAARALRAAEFTTRLEQPHWLAKAIRGDHFVDLIYGMGNGLSFIDHDWYAHSRPGILAATPVRVAPAEELLWHRLFISERHRYDMADIVHLIACVGARLDWSRIERRVGDHWPLLMAQLQTFFYVYPELDGAVPAWLVERMLERARADSSRRRSGARVTRGPIISRFSFAIDVNEWGFVDLRDDLVRRIEQAPVVRAIVDDEVWLERSHIVEEYRARYG